MSQTRVSVEWLFNEIKTYFKFVSLKWQTRIGRSSHRRCSVRKGVLRNFAKFTDTSARASFFNKAAGLRLPSVFLWVLRNFEVYLFYRTTLGACFWIGLSTAGKIYCVCTLLQNTGTSLYRIWESNFWVFPVHLLRLTSFSFYIMLYKRKKDCEFLPVFQLSEIQKAFLTKMITFGHIKDFLQKFFNEVPLS